MEKNIYNEPSQKSFLKTFWYKNKVTKTVKDFQNSLLKKFTYPSI